MGARDWLDRRVQAGGDGVARRYAIVLSLLHALTGVAWVTYKNIVTLVTGDDSVCWPLVDCDRLRPLLTPDLVRGVVAAYVGLGLAAAALFALRRTRAALLAFALATVGGAGLYALDYRLRFNQTYMFAWVIVAFFVARRGVLVVQALVALFYVWAGILKLNREWVTGAALYERPFLVPEALLPAACVYVLILELALVWGLFSSSPAWRWAVYGQLVLFHAVSWKVVGYFYPLLMLGLTAIYPVVWLGAPEAALTFERLRRERTTLKAASAIAAVFSAFQAIPRLFPGDTAVTGEGRLFALHMFDARVLCSGGATVTAGRAVAHVALVNEQTDIRSRCDPIVLLSEAKRLCRALASRPDAVRVDVAVDAKRTMDAAMQPLMRVDDLCRRDVRYSPWRHNDWVGAR